MYARIHKCEPSSKTTAMFQVSVLLQLSESEQQTSGSSEHEAGSKSEQNLTSASWCLKAALWIPEANHKDVCKITETIYRHKPVSIMITFTV